MCGKFKYIYSPKYHTMFSMFSMRAMKLPFDTVVYSFSLIKPSASELASRFYLMNNMHLVYCKSPHVFDRD